MITRGVCRLAVFTAFENQLYMKAECLNFTLTWVVVMFLVLERCCSPGGSIGINAEIRCTFTIVQPCANLQVTNLDVLLTDFFFYYFSLEQMTKLPGLRERLLIIRQLINLCHFIHHIT